jgi:pre-mRNA-splicing factor 18
MDGLLAEISAKRKAMEGERGESSKYMRRSDIERAKEAEITRVKAEEKAKKDAEFAETKAAKMRKEVSHD